VIFVHGFIYLPGPGTMYLLYPPLVGPAYGMQAFLFYHKVWPSCYVTKPQFCYNALWCWRPELMH